MTLVKKATLYAQSHQQEVTLAWIDNSARTYQADKAARLCAVPRIAACIMGAEASDKVLEGMLNTLIDSAEA